MDDVNRNLAFLGGLLRGSVPSLSPTTDDFELMHYLRRPLRPASSNKIEISVKHPRKQNLDGVWMTRDASYTYKLPQSCCNKVLQAQWFADNFLLIKVNSSEVGEQEFVDRARLIIERVDTQLKPNIEMSVIRDYLKDIRDRSQEALQYLRFEAHSAPSPAERDIQDIMNQQSGTLVTSDSGVSSPRVDSPVDLTNEASCSNAGKK